MGNLTGSSNLCCCWSDSSTFACEGLQTYEKLVVGVVYHNSIDKLFRSFRDIAFMLKDWGTTLDDRQLIALFLRAPRVLSPCQAYSY